MKTIINKQDCPSEIESYDLSVFDNISDKKMRLTLMLLFLQELSSMEYKAKCAMNEYCVDSFANAFMSYSKQTKTLRDKIIECCIESEVDLCE